MEVHVLKTNAEDSQKMKSDRDVVRYRFEQLDEGYSPTKQSS